MSHPPKGYVDFEIPFSEEEYEIIERKAAAAGISVQQLVDQCARGLARAIPTNENHPNDDDS